VEQIELVALVVVGVVLLIGVVAFLSSRIGVAAPLVLTVVGIGIGAIPAVPDIELEPELFLTLVLPPLLYAAARQVPFTDFRRNLRVIAVLAVGLVAVSAVAVGVLVHLLWAAIPLALAIALGAVVAPPDAVAATSLGKRLGLPPRIVTILEGEGLINDATALVLLATALAVATGGAEITGWGVALTFLWAVVGAVIAGVAIGWVATRARARLANGVLDMALALVVPFAAFLVAELVGASGVVAVVVAGILVGNDGAFRIPARFRQTEGATWRTFTMLVENAVFLLMGLELWPVVGEVVDDGTLGPVLALAGLVIVLLVALRFAAMPPLLAWIRRRLRSHAAYAERVNARFGDLSEEDFAERAQRMQQLGLRPSRTRTATRRLRAKLPFVRRRDAEERARISAQLEALEGEPVPELDPRARQRVADRFRSWRRRLDQQNNDLTAERDQALGWRDGVILGLAGMRGVVTVVAVQTIPRDAEGRDALVLIAFLVAIVTLVVQGLVLPLVVRALRPRAEDAGLDRAESLALRHALATVGDAAVASRVEELGSSLAPEVADEVRSWSERRVARMEAWAEAELADPDNPVAQYLALRRLELDAQRAELRRLRSLGAYSSEAIARMRAALDSDELELDTLAGNSGEGGED